MPGVERGGVGATVAPAEGQLKTNRRGDSNLVAAVWCLGCALLLACAGRPLASEGPERGSFPAVLARGFDRRAAAQREALPTVVLFGSAEAVGIDARSGDRRWRRPLRVFGAPAVHGRVVVVPVRGHRLVALDGATGAILWQTPSPGQALTGVAIGSRGVVVTAIADGSKARSIAVGLSAFDGHHRWTRRSQGLFGVPAALGPYALVPIGHDVVALRLRTGREAARRPSGRAFGRVELHGTTAVAADRRAFVDLSTRAAAQYELAALYGSAFRIVEGLDPGLGHADGVLWRLAEGDSAGAPREAMFVGRRAVFAVRLDPRGRPVQARWAYMRHEQREFVAVDVDRTSVRLVSEDGALLELDRRSGRRLGEVGGDTATVGARFVGGNPRRSKSVLIPPKHKNVTGALVGVIEDPDPRMLPAQRLAVDLLWRDEDPDVREHVKDLAQGKLHVSGPTAETKELRLHARARMTDTWGPADRESLAELLDKLQTPKASDASTGALLAATRAAVKGGGPGVIPRLLGLLSHPGTRPEDLVEVARAIRDLADSRATSGVCEFVRRYHADAEIVHESAAIYYAVEFLLAQAFPTASHRVSDASMAEAKATVRALLEDRFTIPELVAFITARLPEIPRD